MGKQKRKLLAAVLVIVLVHLIAVASYYFFLAQPISQEPPPDWVLSPPRESLLLDVRLSQSPVTTRSNEFNITKGETVKINVTLTSHSNDTVFTLPLYLSVGTFEQWPLGSAIMITSAPSPYPTLPWPSHEDSPTAPKPFEASFDVNPLILKPGESGTSILTITALEAAELGTYTMCFEMGNWEQTGIGGATFQLEVMSS